MKKYLSRIFLILSLISFLFFILEFIPIKKRLPKTIITETFDPSLQHLNTKKKVIEYCDSIFITQLKLQPTCNKDSLYADIAAVTIRGKFYHNWAEYGIGNNHMALFFSPFFYTKIVTSIINIEDILQSPAAVCGQQSRVLAAILESKNLNVRKVIFNHPVYGGHFAIEVFYQNSWHFFDVDKEPEIFFLRSYDRPSVAFLQINSNLLTKLYSKEDPVMIVELFKTAKAENFKKVEGPNLLIYQNITKILSYSLWAVFLTLFLFIKFDRTNPSVKSSLG